MATLQKCVRCGKELPPEATDGLCPGCRPAPHDPPPLEAGSIATEAAEDMPRSWSAKWAPAVFVAGIATMLTAVAVILAFGRARTNVPRTVADTTSVQPGAGKAPASAPQELRVPAAVTPAENIVFPPDAGVVDVTKPPYHAKGDGKSDDTAAIQQALADYPNEQAIIYLPNGTYLLSDTLRWGEGDGKWTLCKRTTLQGQSRDGTILKLKDACPGFLDPGAPQPVIWTGPNPAERYRNAVRNLTLDTGRGNPGAIGLQFNANYVGCVRDVLIRSADGQGVTGLDMAFTEEIGPLLVKNLTVRGFDVGIHGRGGFSSQTFEHIRLESQNQVAFVNDAESVSIRGLTTTGRVPAFWNKNWVGLAVIVDAKLDGLEGAEASAAITNRPGLFVRNLSVSGFGQAIAHVWPGAERNVPGPLVQAWASREFPDSKPSLNLPVKETPEVPWSDPTDWASPVSFGANPGAKDDASDAIQQAIDSGKRTVYLPRGDYVIRKPIVLRGAVQRLIGCEASLRVAASIPANSACTLADGDSPVVVVERIAVDWDTPQAHPTFIDNASKRTLVLRDCHGIDAEFTGPGEVFLENVAGKFALHGQKVWARQVYAGTSSRTPPDRMWHLSNEGGLLWVLGVRTGGPGPVAITRRGGQTEVLGGMMYSSAGTRVQPEPAFVVEDGALSVSINEVTFRRDVAYPVLVRRTAVGQTSDALTPGQAPGGLNASLVPLFATE